MKTKYKKNKSQNNSLPDSNGIRYSLFQTLMDNIPDYIYIKDDKSRFIMVNEAMAKLFGKIPKDFTGKTDFDIFAEKSAKVSFKDDTNIIKSGKPIIDKTEKIIPPSGKEFWVSCSKVPWYDQNGKIMGTMGISRDITERKHEEDYLLSRERTLFNALMEGTTDHIYFKDKQSCILRINEHCAKVYGVKNPKEAIGKTDFDFFSKEHAQQAYDDEQKIIATKKPIVNIEEKETYKDREDRWVSTTKMPLYDEKGELIGTFGISRDITDKKLMERKLETERSLVNSLMESIPETIYFKDLKSRFIRLNKALAKLVGLKDPDNAIGKTDFDFFSKEHAQQAYEDEQKIIETGQPIVDIEEKETFKDREDRWVSTTKMPLHDEHGEIIGTFGISKDITEKKKAEEKIKYLSFHDVLTSLYNRAYFEEELRRLDTERQLPLTIVMGDVNGLKLMNDAYGHDKGDILLKKISAILQDSFRKEDIVSRWGGDEFIAILPKTYTKDTESMIKRIREKCKKGSTADMPLSISLGVSTKRSPAEDIEKTIKDAEDKMYKNKISESEETHETLINSFKKKLRKRDLRNETVLNKIQDYAVRIGERMNLSKLKLEELRLLMNLHNIGKLALADEIISKPGSLNKEEWKIVKKLPEIGYRIAESSEQLKPIAEAILSHHEWYNGKGYPRGIKGEDIPVLSRISFLVNSFEAMTRDRPYRKRMTYDEAINEIRKYSGVQFDPKVVDIFLDIVDVEKIKKA
jgi:diguanylate cyclase (GGDEF)-like protein/PAS domain S-box-containing protein